MWGSSPGPEMDGGTTAVTVGQKHAPGPFSSTPRHLLHIWIWTWTSAWTWMLMWTWMWWAARRAAPPAPAVTGGTTAWTTAMTSTVGRQQWANNPVRARSLSRQVMAGAVAVAPCPPSPPEQWANDPVRARSLSRQGMAGAVAVAPCPPSPPGSVGHPATPCTSEAGDPHPGEVHAQMPPDCRWRVLHIFPRLGRATILLAAPRFPRPRMRLRGPEFGRI